MQLFIFWLVFPAAAASLAKSKGKSVPLWVVLGLLLGPFAILAVALTKSGEGADKSYQ
ncbi:hypothetical protein [Geothermobacter hydrogeniphilus]|uniref:hypothetical protein n=1 Tax=Geothermobacter hydrogeniphilus TaxID=1969733 RepID=UPI0018EC7B58|nr:hypothetical protein [Geothermobacter hydrogeniphilus]